MLAPGGKFIQRGRDLMNTDRMEGSVAERPAGSPVAAPGHLKSQRKFPYPAFCISSTGMNLIAAEFMQYRRCVG